MKSYEQAFKAKYPNARILIEPIVGTLKRYTVLAGDYVCAESTSKARAFQLAYEYDALGYIYPDPNEQASGEAA